MSGTNLVSFLPVSGQQARLVLGAMYSVAAADGTPQPADIDALNGTIRHILYAGQGIDFHSIKPPESKDLATAFPTVEYRRYILPLIAVMAFVDEKVDEAKLAVVLRYANDLGVTDDYVRDLAQTANGHIDWVKADMSRNNAETFTGIDVSRDFAQQFFPYRTNPDPALVARFKALAALPYESFGRAFFDHYDRAGYKFPGDPDGLSIYFAVPHDSAHVVSGYSTSLQGELLVSTFTAAMHRGEGMSGHILPVIFSWHLGIKLNPLAGASQGAFDGEKFWRAWERGRMTTLDTLGPDWDFWGMIDRPLEQIRSSYEVPKLDAAHAADGEPRAVRPWSAV